MHYDETGPETGKPVVIMHGWGCDHTTVRSIAAALESGMHIYNLDLPGHGKSPEPPGVWGVEEYTRCVEDFIRILGIKNPVLIGHSFGGRISLLLSSRNTVNKMVLVDAAGIKPKRSLKYHVKVKAFKATKKILPLVLGRMKASALLDAWRGKAGSADYRQASPVMRAILSKCVNEDLKNVMPRITAPTLLVWGEKDTATPLSDARYMEKHIPDAGLVSFAGAGHYSFLDNPALFRAVLTEFLKHDIKSISHKHTLTQ